MKKIFFVLIASLLTIFFANFLFTGYAFALNFGGKISEETSLILLGIVLIGVAGFWRKKLYKK